MNTIDWELLAGCARQAAANAHCPYSEFRVGAALLCADGSLYSGANIENSSYGLTVCAERVALWKAISEGKRDFVALLLVAGREVAATPCGACLQVLLEFCPPSLPIRCERLRAGGAEAKCFTLGEAVPYGFALEEAAPLGTGRRRVGVGRGE